MPIEFDDHGLRVYGHNVKGLQFYDWDRVLQCEVYLQEDNTLSISCGVSEDGNGAGVSISAGTWLGDDGAGEFRFQPDSPAVVTAAGIVTEYPTIVDAITAAGSGDSVVIPPGTYDEAITLVDGVRVVELISGTVVLHSTSADVAVTTVGGGYINVKEIKATRGSTNDIKAIAATHATGTCVVVAELIRAENTSTSGSYGIYQTGAGTLWVFAERIQSEGGDDYSIGAYISAGTQYIAAVQVFAKGSGTDQTAMAVRCIGGIQKVWAECYGWSELYAYGAYCIAGTQEVWGDCIAVGEGVVTDAVSAYAVYEDSGSQIIHGNCTAEARWYAWAATTAGGTHIVYGDCEATVTEATGTSYGAEVDQATDAGEQQIWGNCIASGGSTSIGAFADATAQTGAVTQRVHGDVTGDDYGARCDVGTQTITDGRASGDTYDLYQTGGTLQIASVQYDSYSGTITLLPSSLNALILELEDTTELTIATGVVTVTQSYHRIDTQDDDPSDDLDTINGGVTGRLLVIRPQNDARTVVVKHNTGNIWILAGADVSLDDINDHLMLIYDGSKWCSL